VRTCPGSYLSRTSPSPGPSFILNGIIRKRMRAGPRRPRARPTAAESRASPGPRGPGRGGRGAVAVRRWDGGLGPRRHARLAPIASHLARACLSFTSGMEFRVAQPIRIATRRSRRINCTAVSFLAVPAIYSGRPRESFPPIAGAAIEGPEGVGSADRH
jgi:hypothetical protein